MDFFFGFGCGLSAGAALGFFCTPLIADGIKRGFDYLAARGAEPEPPRVPETLGGRARLNANFMDAVRELVREGVFVPAGNPREAEDLGSVYRLSVWNAGGHQRLTVREDGVICEEDFFGLCSPDAPTLLYTQYLEKYPNAPILMDEFESRVEDVRALGEHRKHEREVAREMWKERQQEHRRPL